MNIEERELNAVKEIRAALERSGFKVTPNRNAWVLGVHVDGGVYEVELIKERRAPKS